MQQPPPTVDERRSAVDTSDRQSSTWPCTLRCNAKSQSSQSSPRSSSYGVIVSAFERNRKKTREIAPRPFPVPAARADGVSAAFVSFNPPGVFETVSWAPDDWVINYDEPFFKRLITVVGPPTFYVYHVWPIKTFWLNAYIIQVRVYQRTHGFNGTKKLKNFI